MFGPWPVAWHPDSYLVLLLFFHLLSHWDTDIDLPLAWEQHFPSSLFSPHPSAPPHQGTPGCSSHGLQLPRATYSLGPVTLDPALSPLHQARACWLAFPCHFWVIGSGFLEFCVKKHSEAMWQRALWLICYVCGSKKGRGSMHGMCVCLWYPILL